MTPFADGPRISLVGFSGTGKSSLARALTDLLAEAGVPAAVVKLAAPLYRLQQSYYDIAGVGVEEGAQDQLLLSRIATDLRRISRTALLDDFLATVSRTPPESAIVNDDLRDSEVDAPGLRAAGFTLVRLDCDEEVRRQRLAGRTKDLSRIDERQVFGPAFDAMSFDHRVDTTSATPADCARQVLDFVSA